MAGKRTKTTDERFWAKVDVRGPNECWPWKASKWANGYGQFAVEPLVRHQGAHIYAYETVHGKVPEGLVIDHECHNRDPKCRLDKQCPHRACCNPAHLSVKTRRQNVVDGKTIIRDNVLKTHCKWGHEFTPANTGRNNGARVCRACRREWQRRRRRDRD